MAETAQVMVVDIEDLDGRNIAVYARNSTGEHSLTLLIQDFRPYIFFPVSARFEERHVNELHRDLRARLSQVDSVVLLHNWQPVLYHRLSPEDYANFVRIEVANTSAIRHLETYLAQSGENELCSYYDKSLFYDTTVYESNIPYTLRFMSDTGLASGAWIDLPLELVLEQTGNICISYRDLRVHSMLGSIRYNDGVFQKQPLDSKFLVHAPLRVMLVEFGIIQLPNEPKELVTIIARTRNRIDIMTLSDHGCNIPGVIIHQADDSKELVELFYALIRELDPDIIGDYDINSHFENLIDLAGTEFGRIIDESAGAKLKRKKARVSKRQRVKSSALRQTSAQTTTGRKMRISAPSNREFSVVQCPGRIVLDIRVMLEKDERMRTYGFGEAVRTVLGHETEVLDHFMLAKLWSGSKKPSSPLASQCYFCADERDRMLAPFDPHGHLFSYWTKNTALCGDILESTSMIASIIELASVTGLTMTDVMYKGQMIRFQSQLLSFAHKAGYLVPAASRDPNKQGMQEGSLNLMPDAGYYYTDPVAVLDFKSMYPSIMIAHNLCYSTLLMSDDAHTLGDDLCNAMPAPGDQVSYFAKTDVKRGVIPEILRYLISERDAVKQMMRDMDESLVPRAVLEQRQLALKVSANAIYGSLGAPQSFLQSLPIAEGTIMLAQKCWRRLRMRSMAVLGLFLAVTWSI